MVHSNFQDEVELSQYNFRKFAATYFIKNINPHYSKKTLKESLLELPTPDDVLASQALWITILRFMGDLPEPKYAEPANTKENIMNKITETVGRSFTNRKEFQVNQYYLYISCLADLTFKLIVV